MSQNWQIFQGNTEPHDGIDRLLEIEAPSWRRFANSTVSADSKSDDEYWQKLQEIAQTRLRDIIRGQSFRVPQLDSDPDKNQPTVVDAVNAALYLRRPLLITGKPGSGKTNLAYAIARELKLGPMLVWSVTARSNLQQGLYQYDAIARLQDAQLSQTDASKHNYRNIGQYIRLGPIGTAFLPSQRPRVLLIDEVDKSDINLSNDLLNLLEEGRYEIPELRRLAKRGEAKQQVESEDGLDVEIESGQVQCQAFPMVVMTSNGEREFSSAFLRRCVRVQMPTPEKAALTSIVKTHLGNKLTAEFESVINEFVDRNKDNEVDLATDQLLNTLYLLTQDFLTKDADRKAIKKLLLGSLTSLGTGQ
ncbi:MAG: AAA domain-containing protein [Oscillatoriales cyanobacterium RU_3_3]|nr:AAA domain-containing protein [Oscillatoriales cyanobacterium RU_3_3]NJR25069.1 AAA domain-containing protein [Richelia sp. CSU_2_1]